MVKMADRSVFVDTNVLLTATTPARTLHGKALVVLNEWPLEGVQLLTSGQVLREYLVTATRPVGVNGLGLDVHDALNNTAALRRRMSLLAEDESTFQRLGELVQQARCSGKQVHDANLAATALVHQADSLVTENTADFVRFEEWIEIIALASVETVGAGS